LHSRPATAETLLLHGGSYGLSRSASSTLDLAAAVGCGMVDGTPSSRGREPAHAIRLGAAACVGASSRRPPYVARRMTSSNAQTLELPVHSTVQSRCVHLLSSSVMDVEIIVRDAPLLTIRDRAETSAGNHEQRR